MAFVASTITEHIRHEGQLLGERIGETRGETCGEKRGDLKGQIKILETLHYQGLLTKEQFEMRALPLRLELEKLLTGYRVGK